MATEALNNSQHNKLSEMEIHWNDSLIWFLCRFREDDIPLLSDERASLFTNGTIGLGNVSHNDQGLYTCSVDNTKISITANLEVFSK